MVVDFAVAVATALTEFVCDADIVSQQFLFDLCFCLFSIFQADFNSLLLLNVFVFFVFLSAEMPCVSIMTNRIALQLTHTSKSIHTKNPLSLSLSMQTHTRTNTH